MKVNLLPKSIPLLLLGVLFIFFFLFFSENVFSNTDPLKTSAQSMLNEINKKLDASQKREEQILANQEKIIAEIIKSRKWAFNN